MTGGVRDEQARPLHAAGQGRHAADEDVDASAGTPSSVPLLPSVPSPVDAIAASAVPDRAPRPRPRGIATRARGLVGRIALDVLALGGLVCILLVIASFVFKISIVMFATGSMSPTIPAGSIALVREVPATEIAVGDVVTVDRSESQQLPVTHRVIEILGEDEGVVTFRMQGDDNADADPEPYVESTVRLVLWSAPGLATVIVQLQNPLVLGGITIGATVLVTWAFWPRERRDEVAAASQHAD